MNTQEELRLSELVGKLRDLGLHEPPERIFKALENIERAFSEALNHEAIGAWCTDAFFKLRGTRPLGHSREAYRQRLMEAARRMGHPLLLTAAVDQLSRQIANDNTDPIGVLDEMLRHIPLQ